MSERVEIARELRVAQVRPCELLARADDRRAAAFHLDQEKKGGDPKKLAGLFKRLDANCTNCHNDFRD